uniref:Origin recognition complex subunit 5 n=1 Tax=Phallusia mammillata TaxID=59560 RepID=A0A6F9DNK9_9ASCI|nr:origin recognition complex subunit 5-like [Phallusia mammillata]
MSHDSSAIPARGKQIEQLISIFGDPVDVTMPALFVYGHSSCGKTIVLNHVLEKLKVPHVVVNCTECYTNSVLFSAILQGLSGDNDLGSWKCDNLNDLGRNLRKVYESQSWNETVYIVFDKAERLRDREVNLLPALINLQELTSLNFCVILVSELPWEKFYNGVGIRQPFIVFFPDYTKSELGEILCHCRPDGVDREFYQHYISIVLAVFSLACRDLRELKHLSELNFSTYCAPVKAGKFDEGDKHKLWKHVEPHLKEALQQLYLRKVSSEEWMKLHDITESGDATVLKPVKNSDTIELPFYSKFLLIAAYIASYNPASTDKRFFVKNAGRMKKTARSMKKDERKNSHLRGPHAFPLDRMMAIFYSIVDSRVPPTANIFSQISTLVTLHLLAKIGHEDEIDCPRYKCTVSLDFISAVAKTMNFDIVRYLFDFV